MSAGLALKYHRVIYDYATVFCERHGCEFNGFVSEYSDVFWCDNHAVSLADARIDVDLQPPADIYWEWHHGRRDNEYLDYLKQMVI